MSEQVNLSVSERSSGGKSSNRNQRRSGLFQVLCTGVKKSLKKYPLWKRI
ncbi:MAG: hypothetical protein Ct9H300mP3_10660 [Gammaproteobacteria bacterium]|nr:MAG: hypothetical protein Ct9H300mP3_10660 [Gammaproteobacteria bacterium]